jgi:hypothetical protein
MNTKKSIHKQLRIKPMTKQDKQHITNILDKSLNQLSTRGNLRSTNYDSSNCWVDSLEQINLDSLQRSLAQILNSTFDFYPETKSESTQNISESNISESNISESNISTSNVNVTILEALTKNDTIFRFAPSPSGYLHIGHFVPILLNTLLRCISRKTGNKSDIIIRIDDTNPNEDDYSVEICNTLKKLFGSSYEQFIFTRSSDMTSKIIEMIDKSILSGSDKFYVDLSDQKTIQTERKTRSENKYRMMNTTDQIDLWNKMKSISDVNNNTESKIDTKSKIDTFDYFGVVRAKIDMKSDNGNLRDPVVLRFVNNGINNGVNNGINNGVNNGVNNEINNKSILMPTYDLVCPVLDSLDSGDRLMIALRDCNYLDRLEQYRWMQDALNLKQTAILTFSRVNFENVLLSKRKIKALINESVEVSVDSSSNHKLFQKDYNCQTINKISRWDDPRLMTLDGIFNRGMTIAGLLHFYWLTGHISVGNRSTSQDIRTLFDINDKVLSRNTIFIVDRMPITFTINKTDDLDNINKYMLINIERCISGQSKSSNVLDDSNISDNGENIMTSIPTLVHVQTLICLKNRLISSNLRYTTKLMTENNLVQSDLNDGTNLIDKYKLSENIFKTCSDIKIGETIKINNFKDLSEDPDFGGYYYVKSKDIVCIDGVDIEQINVLHIS